MSDRGKAPCTIDEAEALKGAFDEIWKSARPIEPQDIVMLEDRGHQWHRAASISWRLRWQCETCLSWCETDPGEFPVGLPACIGQPMVAGSCE